MHAKEANKLAKKNFKTKTKLVTRKELAHIFVEIKSKANQGYFSYQYHIGASNAHFISIIRNAIVGAGYKICFGKGIMEIYWKNGMPNV